MPHLKKMLWKQLLFMETITIDSRHTQDENIDCMDTIDGMGFTKITNETSQ